MPVKAHRTDRTKGAADNIITSASKIPRYVSSCSTNQLAWKRRAANERSQSQISAK